MSKIRHIAVNTFRETVRDKVLYNLVLFAVLIIASSYILSKISVYQEIRIIKDLGLAAISVFGIVISIFIGIGLVSKEIEKKTLYSVLPKPIARYEFIVGKYLGLCLTLLINTLAMAFALLLLLKLLGEPLQWGLLSAIFLIYVKLALLTAVALWFSTFTSPTLAALFSGFVYIAGYLSADLKNFETIVEAPLVSSLAKGLYYFLPNFKNFDVKAVVVAGDSVSASQIALASGYGLVYVAILLLASTVVFQNKDLK